MDPYKKLNISRKAVQSIIGYKIKKMKKKREPKPIVDKDQSLILQIFISQKNEKWVKVTAKAIFTVTIKKS